MVRAQSVLLLVAVVLCAFPPAYGTPVYFTDFNLRVAAVELARSLTNPAPAEMLTLNTLWADRWTIAPLTGIEYASNREGLQLGANQITDIVVVSGMTKFTGPYQGDNQISDRAPLPRSTTLRRPHRVGYPPSIIEDYTKHWATVQLNDPEPEIDVAYADYAVLALGGMVLVFLVGAIRWTTKRQGAVVPSASTARSKLPGIRAVPCYLWSSGCSSVASIRRVSSSSLPPNQMMVIVIGSGHAAARACRPACRLCSLYRVTNELGPRV
jgi:hypothetical protein